MGRNVYMSVVNLCYCVEANETRMQRAGFVVARDSATNVRSHAHQNDSLSSQMLSPSLPVASVTRVFAIAKKASCTRVRVQRKPKRELNTPFFRPIIISGNFGAKFSKIGWSIRMLFNYICIYILMYRYCQYVIRFFAIRLHYRRKYNNKSMVSE